MRQELAVALGVLTASLHDAGFVHHDFHPGNLLVRIGDDDRPSLAMIDLGRKGKGAEDTLAVKDVSELVAESLEG